MTKLKNMYDVFRLIGEDPSQILTTETPYLVAYGNEVMGMQMVEGVIIIPHRTKDGIEIGVTVVENRRIEKPVHLCFGLFERFGVQNVTMKLTMQANSSATFWSHCLFTSEIVRHAMTASVELQANADLTYNEVHYHGTYGDIKVMPQAEVTVGSGAHYRADFSLVQGRVGNLVINYNVNVGEAAVAELISKVHGHVTDEIHINERVSLNGDNARGLIKSRVAVEDEASAEVIGATYGNAAGARGHVDCLEVVRGNGVVSAVPEVRVTHPLAKVTHEAAIGSIDQKQLETLMARGLSPEQAIDRIILGLFA